MPDYNKQNPTTIQQMFNNIAKGYDRTNAILSFQLHKRWNAALVNALSPQNFSGDSLLDLCSGTGDIAFAYLKQQKTKKKVCLLDFSSQMLACAQHKAEQRAFDSHDLTFLEADAQKIPLPGESFSLASIAYGIRNVKEPRKCLAEVFRVLKPGGRFGILELTQPRHPMLRFGHRLYLHTVLPTIGKWVTADRGAYEYLCRSIQRFIEPEELQKLLIDTGFGQVEITPLSGGIATLITAQKA